MKSLVKNFNYIHIIERLDSIENKIDDLKEFIEEKCFKVSGTANISVSNITSVEVDEGFINVILIIVMTVRINNFYRFLIFKLFIFLGCCKKCR